MTEVRQGGCRCGRVRFEASGAPLLTLACHCTGCQRMTASAFTLTDTYPTAAFRVTQGDVVAGGLKGPTRHQFCDDCKSWLYTEPEGMSEFVNVRSTMFDQSRREPPFVEIFVAEGLPWAATGATYSYQMLPPMDEWPKLAEKFAAQGAVAVKEPNL